MSYCTLLSAALLFAQSALFFGSKVLPVDGTPTFSPSAGVYASGQSVAISTGTSGATLCYTTDGSTPTALVPGTCSHGTTYSTAVSVGSSLTLKAIATKVLTNNSPVGSAVYTIGLTITNNNCQTGQLTTATIGCRPNVSSGMDPVVNSYLVVAATNFSTTNAITGCADSASPSNNYTATPQSPVTANGGYYWTFKAKVTNTAVNLTVSCSQATSGTAFVMSVVNVSLPSGTQDGNFTAQHLTGTTSCTAPSITTSNEPDLALTFLYSTNTTFTLSAPSGWTLIPNLPTSTASAAMGGTYKITSATGSLTPSITISSTGNCNTGGLAVY